MSSLHEDNQTNEVSRRAFLLGAAGALATLAGCGSPYDEDQAMHGTNRYDRDYASEQARSDEVGAYKTEWDSTMESARQVSLGILLLMADYEASSRGDDAALRWEEGGDKGTDRFYSVLGNPAGRQEFYEQNGNEAAGSRLQVDRLYPIVYASITERSRLRVVYAENEDGLQRIEVEFAMGPDNEGLSALDVPAADEIDETRPYREHFIGAVTDPGSLSLLKMTVQDKGRITTIEAVTSDDDFTDPLVDNQSDYTYPAFGEEYSRVLVDGQLVGQDGMAGLNGKLQLAFDTFSDMRQHGCMLDNDDNCVY